MLTIEQKIDESNRIEGIVRPCTNAEIEEFHRFIEIPIIGLEDLQTFVRVYQPNALLRINAGMDVMVGTHAPKRGGPEIYDDLFAIITGANEFPDDAWGTHLDYENLHPFTDGNGRSGRMLWYWCMHKSGQKRLADLGFLHAFYYQTLDSSDNEIAANVL